MVFLPDSSDKYTWAEQSTPIDLLPRPVAKTGPAVASVSSEESDDEELPRRVLDVREKSKCVPQLRLNLEAKVVFQY